LTEDEGCWAQKKDAVCKRELPYGGEEGEMNRDGASEKGDARGIHVSERGWEREAKVVWFPNEPTEKRKTPPVI
jgi:hypothetical protein